MDDAYRIFVSHRYTRHSIETVNVIVRALDGLSDSVAIVNPRQAIHPGFDWRSQLIADLQRSDMLLLVYTDPNDDWSWCTFEAGLFTRLENLNEPQPIVCLHHRDATPPRQLDYLQCVPAEPDGLAEFLECLLCTTEITRSRWPLDRSVDRTRIANAAKAIARSFADVSRYYAVHRIVVEIPEEPGSAAGIPDDATVVAATPGTWSLFGSLDDRAGSWAQLVKGGRSGERALPQPCLDELDTMFAKASHREDPGPSTTTFLPHASGEHLRPAIYSVQCHGGRPSAVEILLIPQPAPATVGGGVFRMLRSLERFKAELLDRFLDRGDGTPQLAVGALAELSAPLDSITSEADKLGTFDPERMRTAFPDPVVHDRLMALRERFAEHTGRLRRAIQDDDGEAARVHLVAIDAIVETARRAAAQRYYQLVAGETVDLRDAAGTPTATPTPAS